MVSVLEIREKSVMLAHGIVKGGKKDNCLHKIKENVLHFFTLNMLVR